MGYAEFLKKDGEGKDERGDVYSFYVCSWKPGEHDYNELISLDKEDMDYFRNKAKRMLEKERQDEIAAVNKKYDRIKPV